MALTRLRQGVLAALVVIALMCSACGGNESDPSRTATASQATMAPQPQVQADDTTSSETDTTSTTTAADDTTNSETDTTSTTTAADDTTNSETDTTSTTTAADDTTNSETDTTSTTTAADDTTVTVAAPAAVAVEPDTVTLPALGDTVLLAAEVRDPLARPMDSEPVGWLSSDPLVATVNSLGLVTAVGNGAATITATAGEVAGIATVTVAVPNVEAVFDSLMLEFISERDIGAAALAVMRDGEIVYDKAFGWMDESRVRPVRQDVVMRVASISKVVTAVAIRRLIAEGKVALDDYVFDLGQETGGLLDLDPVPSLGDPRIAEITVRHLLVHESGLGKGIWWDNFAIAAATGEPVPVSREATIRYLIGLPLEFAPGSTHLYSNPGFLVLGHIVETVSGQDYMDYVHETIFAPLGIGREDFIFGRSLPTDRSDREPWYDSRGFPLAIDLFDPSGPWVPWPDGGWDQGMQLAYGGLAASTTALLKFIEVYQASHDEFLGMARRNGWGWYQGRQMGNSALVRQTPSGINYAAIFNRAIREEGSGNLAPETGYPLQLSDLIDELLASGRIVWPEPTEPTASPPAPHSPDRKGQPGRVRHP